jgi:hypothetical protein
MWIVREFFNVYRPIMTALARAGLKLGIVLLVLFILIYGALFFIVRSAKVRTWVQAQLSERSGSEVRVAELRLRPPFNIVAEALEVSKLGELLFTASRLTATISPFDVLSRTLHRVDVEKPVLQLDLQEMMKSPSKTSAKIALRHLNVQDGTIVLKKGEATVFELPNINLAAENLNLGERSGISLRADVPRLNGEAELQMTGQPRNLETEIVIRPKQSQGLFSRQKPKDAVPELVRLHAKLHAPESQEADVTIEGKFHDLTIGDGKITGDLDTHMKIDAGWTVAAFSGRAALTDFPKAIRAHALQLPNGKAAANFAGTFALPSKTLSLKTVELSSPFGNGAGEAELRFEPQAHISNAKVIVREIPLDNLKTLFPAPYSQWIYQGRAQMELDVRGALDALEVKGVARSDTLQVRGENVNVANLTVAAPFEWMKPALRIREAKLTATKPVYGVKDRWQSSAERLQMSASLDVKANEPLKISGRIETAGAKFNSPDSSRVGDNLTLRGPFEILLSPAKNSASINGKFTAETGELLWGKFFGDLKSQQPALELDGDYSRNQDRFECRRCNLTLAKIGAVDLAGSIERLGQSPALRLQARSANFSPGAFFEFFLRENFKRQYPVLEKLGVGGQMTFQLDLSGALDALVAEGEVSLKAGELRVDANDWQIAPIALNLPLLIRLSGAGNVSNGSPKTGTLSIAKARFGQQSVGPLSTTVSLSNNALRFHQPIRLNLFGGEIAIANLLWPDLVGDAKRVSFSAEVKRLQLEELTQALNWHRFTGTLTGSIPQVQSADNLLRTTGEIQAELFGGRMRISKLEIENPFSSLPSIKLDARLNDIQLEQVSSTFEFGRISGILEGSIEDLVLTNGQPAELRADFHSVEGRGAEQRISVEAINKITVLSSGQNAGALYGGLAGFFDSFRYSKLGFKATLKNDRLTLRGVETRGDQEFLVVGSFLPPTVNIISHTQNIAFSELLRRLERIKSEKPNVK